jgi:hypothetical protein
MFNSGEKAMALIGNFRGMALASIYKRAVNGSCLPTIAAAAEGPREGVYGGVVVEKGSFPKSDSEHLLTYITNSKR